MKGSCKAVPRTFLHGLSRSNRNLGGQAMCYPGPGPETYQTRAGTREGGCLSQKRRGKSLHSRLKQIEETAPRSDLRQDRAHRCERSGIQEGGHHAVPGAGPQPKSSPRPALMRADPSARAAPHCLLTSAGWRVEITFNPLTADKVNSEWAEACSTLYLQHTHILIERRKEEGENTAESGV